MHSDDVLLATQALTVRYGGVLAVNEVSLRVPAGRVTGLIGPNGAGKTSLVDAVTGFTPSSGEIRLRGERLDGRPAHFRAQAGLARTWQSLELFQDLTVRQNVQVAARRLSIGSVLLDMVRPGRHAVEERVTVALERAGLLDAAETYPGELSLGQRKLLGVARALAPDPDVLLMDEPAAGLDTDESMALGDRIRSIAAAGTGVLLIDHDMGLVLDVCDEVYVLEFGALIAHGTPDSIRSNDKVVAAYLGTHGTKENRS
ncbi:ABC transporter ATP-binding protein [Streptomyces sp. NPDC012935]|uniref:ABC transporter ATP-binding protein n=1 Tax=Streptomyces sp. NPDC012935 TaxID=3364857 RepID=UPI00368849A5